MDSREARHGKKEEVDSPPIWSSLSVLAVALAAGFILARLEAGPRYDWLLLMTAMGLTAAVLMRVLADNAAEREAAERYAGDPLKENQPRLPRAEFDGIRSDRRLDLLVRIDREIGEFCGFGLAHTVNSSASGAKWRSTISGVTAASDAGFQRG